MAVSRRDYPGGPLKKQKGWACLVEAICERHNLPHTINIFGHKINVEIVSGFPGTDTDDEVRRGEARMVDSPMTIRIREMSEPIMVYQTFVHEIIEIINGEMELELPHAQITRLELGLTNFLLNNDIDWGYTNGIARD